MRGALSGALEFVSGLGWGRASRGLAHATWCVAMFGFSSEATHKQPVAFITAPHWVQASCKQLVYPMPAPARGDLSTGAKGTWPKAQGAGISFGVCY